MLHYTYVEGEYREAYEVTVRYLGEDAFDLYPLLSYLSLCTSEPAVSLGYLCKNPRGHDIYRNNELHPHPFTARYVFFVFSVLEESYGISMLTILRASVAPNRHFIEKS